MKHADAKVRCLAIFAAHQDGALSVISSKFRDYTTADHARRDRLENEVDAVLEETDKAVETLAREFPSLEDLVSAHDSQEFLSTSAALAEWVDRDDHIQEEED